MEKFWKWLEEQGYGHLWGDVKCRTKEGLVLTKRMLIGFKIDYLYSILPSYTELNDMIEWSIIDSLHVLNERLNEMIEEKAK